MILRRALPRRVNRIPIVALLDTGGSAANITPDAIASTATVYAPTLTPGAVTITLNAMALTATVYAPTLSGAAASITPDAIASTATVYAPTLAAGAVTITPAAIASTATVYAPDLLTSATIGGVLTVDSTNPRYFRNDSGIVVLSGFHTWYTLVDGGASDPPAAFDYATWLDYVDTRGGNYHKLWTMETAQNWPDVAQYFAPLPWARTGPGNAADGKLKFDLTTFDTTYFERLRERAILAGNRGHYVAVQLFQGWHIEQKPGATSYQPFDYHPFQNGNNINSIDGDTDNDGAGEETRSTSFTAVYNLQKAYVEKVIDTLNDLDNVIWEISNEEGTFAETWEKALVDYVHTYEAGKAKQHPVGMTKIYPSGTNSMLTTSNAEWVSLDDDLSSPEVADGSFVVLYDTDHVVGLTGEYKWVWRAFCRGNNPVYMDEYDGTLYGSDRRNSTYDKIRYNLGAVLDYAARLDLANATPNGALSSTGFALAKTTGAVQILAYQDTSGAFTVNLTSITGTFSVEWLRTAANVPSAQAGSNVSGGAVRTLTPPWSGEDVVAFLEKLADEISPNFISSTATVYAPTLTAGAVTITPDAISSGAAVYAPTLAPGAVTITPDAIASTTQVYEPTLAGAAPTIYPDAIAATSTVYALTLTPGAVTITLDAIASTTTVYAPTLTTGAYIYPDTIASTAVVYAPTLTPGAATITPDAIASVAVVYAPTLQPGAVTITPDAIASSATVYAPTLTGAAPTIYPDAIGSTAQVYEPTLTPGAVTITPDAIASTAQVYEPYLGSGTTQTIYPDIILSTTVVYAATVTAIVAERIYRVATESRVYQVEYENRTYTVQGD